MYYIHLCLNGRMDKKLETWVFTSRREWKIEKEMMMCDIIDETDNEIWFDYGDE